MGLFPDLSVPERVNVSVTAGLDLEVARVRAVEERENVHASTVTVLENAIEITTATTITIITFFCEYIFSPTRPITKRIKG
jgi:hypothetical protein